jgi:di- and tripeptidase
LHPKGLVVGVTNSIKVWDCDNFGKLYEIHSTYDVGDYFCVAYSSRLNVIYLGAQNTSIQVGSQPKTILSTDEAKWYDLNEETTKPVDHTKHPYFRQDRFFDSKGPGGIPTPKPDHCDTPPSWEISRSDLQLDRQYVIPFAHYGYVYCMLLFRGILTDDPETELLVTGGGDGSIKVWTILPNCHGQIRQLCELGSEREDRESVLSLALDGSFLVSGRLGGEVNIWDLDTRQLVRTLKSGVQDVHSLSVGGGYLLAAGTNGKVEVCFLLLQFLFQN